MKTNARITLTILSFFCFCLVCSAQKRHFTAAQILTIQKNDIKNSPYIFEGTVIQQSKIGESLTCSVIQITKIYRGNPQINLGTIKVITEQNRNTKDGDPGLGRGHYIIFGRQGDSTVFRSITTGNNITIALTDLSVAIYGQNNDGYPAAQWGTTKYNDVDSLYSFFKENGLMVQEQVPQADSTKH